MGEQLVSVKIVLILVDGVQTFFNNTPTGIVESFDSIFSLVKLSVILKALTK